MTWAEANAHLLDFTLPERANVWDVGGYEGEWAAGMLQRSGISAVRVFEPVPEYARAIAEKLAGAGVVEQFGLVDRDCSQSVVIAGDRSSTYTGVGLKVKCEFHDVVQILGDFVVDVMKLNVEGAEYQILERLLAADKMRQIRSLLVQFHTFIPEFGERYLKIRDGLRRTHDLKWRMPFIWERWDVKA